MTFGDALKNLVLTFYGVFGTVALIFLTLGLLLGWWLRGEYRQRVGNR